MHSYGDFEEHEEVSMIDFGGGMSLVFWAAVGPEGELIIDLSTTVHDNLAPGKNLAVCMLYCVE